MQELTIIIPVYNAEKYINRLCLNLCNQTIFEKLEIIFVNDGSKDKTGCIIKQYLKQYSNITLITQSNEGVSSARNKGIEKSTCDKIFFLDSDDYLDNNYFEKILEKKDNDLVVSGYISEYSNKTITKKYEMNYINENQNIIKAFLYGKIDPNCWGKLYDKNILKEIRFNELYSHSEDRLFVYQYLKKCNNVVFENSVNYHYVINNESVMRKSFNYNMFNSIEVMNFINKDVKLNYENFTGIAESCLIDAKCRVISLIELFKVKDDYNNEYKSLLKSIRKYSIIKKIKYSSFKHVVAFIIIRINVYLYNFIKYKLKFQYK